MKKKIAVFAVVCTAVLFMIMLVACDDFTRLAIPSADAESLSEQVVRIHIRANSNNADDQGVKLEVRDAVTAYLTEKLDGCKSKSDALETLESERENLCQIAQNTLYANGYNYKASVELKSEYFPERTYDGYVFPEGTYDALMIYLGEGAGDNWWCVAFPPLCFVPDADGEDIVYKSWVREMLDKIFG